MAKNEVLIRFKVEADGARVQVGEFDEILKSTAEEAGNVTKLVAALRKEVQSQSNTAANSVKNLKKYRSALVNVAESVDMNSEEFAHLQTEILKTDTAIKKASASQGSFSTTAGRSGAALTEFGRIIADAPYGIQGVANNVEQFSQQFVDLTRETGSVRKALGSLLKSLIGAGGIVIAVQLASAAYQMLSKYMKENNEGAIESAKAYASAAANLRTLRTLLQEGNLTEEERVDILKAANEEYEHLNLNLENSEDATRKNIDALDIMIEAMAEAAKTRALQSLVEQEYAKIAESEVQRSIQRQRWYGSLLQGASYFLDNLTGLAVSYDAQVAKSSERIQEYISMMEDLTALFDSPERKKNEVEDILTLEEELAMARMKFERSRLEMQIGSIARRMMLEKEGTKEFIQLQIDMEKAIQALRDWDADYFAEKEDEKQRVSDLQQDLFEKRIADNMELEKKHVQSQIASVENILENEEITAEYRAELELELYELRKRNGEILEEESEKQKEKFREALDMAKQGIDALQGLLGSQIEKEIALEKNKTTALNEQLRERLRSEQLNADQRDQINKQISDNEAKLVEKENELNKKRFQQEKAFNISKAIISTAEAIAEASPDPFRIAFAAALGIAQIATIKNQQFVERPTAAPNLVSQSSGAATAGPSFNVVGASPRNQLAEAIGGMTESPLKAYIVSSDVTTAQELDRKIVEGASI